MLSDENLAELLKNANDRLCSRVNDPSIKKLRERLVGLSVSIYELNALTPEQINSLSESKPVVAIDGSVNSKGLDFPNIIYLFQAYAKTSSNEGVVFSDLFSPLLPDYNKRLSEISVEENLPESEIVLNKAKNCILASLELKAACRAIEQYRPWLVLFDGGFMRFSRHASRDWEEYCRLADSEGVISVGIIEEAESYGFSRLLGLEKKESPPAYDRELLFGQLNKGECIMLSGEKQIKSEFYTVFARLSRSPQVTAYDFLPGLSEEDIKKTMHFLYTITPSGSRGIPLLLDMVDSDVRISYKEMELLLTAYLDARVREKFFISNRNKRDY